MSAADAVASALSALRAERAKLDRAIASLEQLAATDGTIVPRANPSQPEQSSPNPSTPEGSRATPKRSWGARTTPGGNGAGKLGGKESEIRTAFESGMLLREIGAKFGCSDEAVRLLAKKLNWTRPAPPEPPIRRVARGVSGRPD